MKEKMVRIRWVLSAMKKMTSFWELCGAAATHNDHDVIPPKK